MTKYLVGFLVGFGATAGVLLIVGFSGLSQRWLTSRRSPLGPIPVAGIVLAVAQILGEVAARLVSEASDAVDLAGVTEVSREVVLVGVIGFAVAGLVDDVLSPSTFGGHLGMITHIRSATLVRRLLIAGTAAGVTTIYLAGEGLSDHDGVVDLVVIALCANAADLLDRQPARVAKISLLASAVSMVASGRRPELTGVAMVAGSVTAFAIGELRGRVTLGSSGAMPVGAAVGCGVVMVSSTPVVFGVITVCGGIALLAELDRLEPAFSSGLLRAFDRLGR